MKMCVLLLTTVTGTLSFLASISHQHLPAQSLHRCQTHSKVTTNINSDTSNISSTNSSSNNLTWVLCLASHQAMLSQANLSAMACLLVQPPPVLPQHQSNIPLPRRTAIWAPRLLALVLLPPV